MMIRLFFKNINDDDDVWQIPCTLGTFSSSRPDSHRTSWWNQRAAWKSFITKKKKRDSLWPPNVQNKFIIKENQYQLSIVTIIIIIVHLVRIAIGCKAVKANNVSKEDCDAFEVLTQVLIMILMMMMRMMMNKSSLWYMYAGDCFCGIHTWIFLTCFPFFDFILFTMAG